jgi:Chaperone of endosialidase
MKLQNLIHILSWIACLGLFPNARAVVPPPDGGYPGFTTAEGQKALFNLTTGSANTAVGWLSLFSNAAGSFNTATGAGTLLFNTADANTAFGTAALLFNTTGTNNTAVGAAALLHNTIAEENTATGAFALSSNTQGDGNTAVGANALLLNTTGGANTAIGSFALLNSIGVGNTAIGYGAGSNVSTANGVICIGHNGQNVTATTWIENVYGATTQSGTTAPVIVSDDGQLGTIASSERFKKDIATMDNASEAILSLRPVTFHYKTDAKGIPQFGLIAEEVAKVNPALVLPDKEGKPYTVRYDSVNAMLLNEFLKAHRKVQELEANAARQQKQIEALTAGLQKVSAELEASKPASQVVNHP